MHVYIDFVSISGVTSSCSISLNVGIVICIVSSVSVRPVNKIAKKKKKKNVQMQLFSKLKKKNVWERAGSHLTSSESANTFFFILLEDESWHANYNSRTREENYRT